MVLVISNISVGGVSTTLLPFNTLQACQEAGVQMHNKMVANDPRGTLRLVYDCIDRGAQ